MYYSYSRNPTGREIFDRARTLIAVNLLKASPGAAMFRRNMLFDLPFIADWKQIGEYRQRQTDRSKERENKTRVNFDYKVGNKGLIPKDGTLRKAESRWIKEPWTITTIHTNGTIRIQCGTKNGKINFQRVTPFSEELLI